MPKQSAGLLLFRDAAGALEVLLVHPGGPFWSHKDAGAWSIPKGEIEAGEDPLAAAIREFEEETGATVAGDFVELPPVRQRSGKVVRAWAVAADFDPHRLRSNAFSMPWPPKSGLVREFPEVDRAAWFSLGEARVRINAAQAPLLEHLRERWQAGALQPRSDI
jgi:predicted NUDIX family NTP pyrophosphohydrolase